MITTCKKLLREAGAPRPRGRAPRTRRRLPEFPGVRPEHVEAILDSLRVLVAGCGALGRPIAIMLARLFPREIIVADPDRYFPENLETQAQHSAEIGRHKAETVARIAAEISPWTWTRYYNGRVQDLFVSGDLEDLTRLDVVVSLGDTLKMTADVGELCTQLGKPLVHAAVDGATMVSQVRSYRNATAESPCPGCSYNRVEWEHHDRETVFSCGGAGPRDDEAPPTMSGPDTCATAAGLGVTQLLRLMLGLGEPVDDTMLEFCGFTGRSVTNALHRTGTCRMPHVRYEVGDAPRPLADCSIDDLLARPGGPPAGDDALLRLAGWEWGVQGACRCHHAEPQEISRFIPAGAGRGGSCCACGGELEVRFDHRFDEFSPGLLASFRSRPLRELGADPLPWALRSHGNTRTLFRNPVENHD